MMVGVSLDDFVPADLLFSALCLADVILMFGKRSLSITPAAWAILSTVVATATCSRTCSRGFSLLLFFC